MNDKHEVYRKLKEMGVSPVMVKKLTMSNIIFPKFADIGILKDMFRQYIRTYAHPAGELYPENEYRVVWRVCGGKLYGENGLLDIYGWTDEDFNAKATSAVPIGRESTVGLLNLTEFLPTITSYEDRFKVADMFRTIGIDLLLVDSKEEIRSAVEVTKDLLDAGIISCIDKWEKKKADGTYPETKLSAGDYLIMDHDQEMVYCIHKEPFHATHVMLWK